MPFNINDAAAELAREVLLAHLVATVARMKTDKPHEWIDEQRGLLEAVIADVASDQGIRMVVAGKHEPVTSDFVTLIRHNIERLADLSGHFLGPRQSSGHTTESPSDS